MTSGRVLYYPYTHFRDTSWLKLAALYYEEITRIIPAQFTTNDPRDVQELTDAGFLTQADPTESAETIAQAFIDYAKRYLSDKQQRAKLFPELALSGKGFRIQPGKMAPEVRKLLEQLQPQLHLPQHSDDFDLDPVTGGVYMAFLAKRMSEECSIPIATHDPLFQKLIYKSLTSEASPKADAQENTFALASLVIQNVVPMDAASIPVDSIIKFREKHCEARLAFSEAITTLAKGVDLSDNEQTLKKYLEDKRRQVNTRVRGLKKSMLDSGIQTAQSTLLLSVPSWAVGSWALNLQKGHAVIGVASLSAVVGLYRGYRDVQRVGRENPWAYVLSLKNLRPGLLSRLQNRNELVKLF